ncbi:MAG: UDP-2,3-diacylglucosamine diphosphatase LpxI [Devosia sp.]|nr:UDP-2,3-diacylglucosamine diphosphatase LpxI [Devosia sp.]
MSRRLTILAGSGALVPEIISGAKAAGDEVQVLPLVDRADLGLEESFGVADLPKLLWRITSFRTTHVTMVGGLKASSGDREAFKRFARAGGSSGDAALLKIAEKLLAMTGAKVVGAEAIVPGILAGRGNLAGPVPAPALLAVASRALDTARAIGRLDVGQAVIVSPSRVIAVEDVAGTDALLRRVAAYLVDGLDPGEPLVLAKALKPQQSRLVDRPAIGPQTVHNAAAAGISIIALEADGAILIDRPGIEAAAQQHGISVIGMDGDGG